MVASAGLDHVTVAQVAKASGVSSALVHYHFATKQKLLAAAAERLATRRAERRGVALATTRGLSSLDALWDALADPRSDAERSAPDLLLLARQDREVAAMIRRLRAQELSRVADALPPLFAGLGARMPIPAEELAATVCLFLDGAVVALLAGSRADDVRASYDAFWLALVALGQAAPRGP